MTAPADFSDAFKVVLRHEGGFSNHPSDRGGATRWGVTEAVARAHGYRGEMEKLPLAVAEQIYKADYWNPLQLFKLPASAQPIATYSMDMAINHGVGGATRLIQRAANTMDYALTVDGQFGPQTLAAMLYLATKYQRGFLGAMKVERGIFFKSLVVRNPSQRAFLRGWMARCA